MTDSPDLSLRVPRDYSPYRLRESLRVKTLTQTDRRVDVNQSGWT